MRQSGHWGGDASIDAKRLRELLDARILQLDIEALKREVRPFLRDPHGIDVWSREFFHAVARRLRG